MSCDLIYSLAHMAGYAHRKASPRTATMLAVLPADAAILGDFPWVSLDFSVWFELVFTMSIL